MLDEDVKKYIDKSVLCWLATCDSKAVPNVSPKEMFTYQDDKYLLIAHLASPVSIRNIRENPNVCVSFVDVFGQKGYKLKGQAEIIEKDSPEFEHVLGLLTALFTDRFPVKSVIRVLVTGVSKIIAPSYFLFSQTTEESQIADALKTYHVRSLE